MLMNSLGQVRSNPCINNSVVFIGGHINPGLFHILNYEKKMRLPRFARNDVFAACARQDVVGLNMFRGSFQEIAALRSQ